MRLNSTLISKHKVAVLSIFAFKMCDSEYAICPYNKSHRILRFRMPGHIIKCVRSYRGPPLEICKYNATHRLPAELMDKHLEECADYNKFHQYENLQKALQARRSPPRA